MDLEEMNEAQWHELEDEFNPLCPECEHEMEWKECWSCGGEGGRGWEDLQFEDPLWYDEDDFVVCDICKGEGGFWTCRNPECIGKDEESE